MRTELITQSPYLATYLTFNKLSRRASPFYNSIVGVRIRVRLPIQMPALFLRLNLTLIDSASTLAISVYDFRGNTVLTDHVVVYSMKCRISNGGKPVLQLGIITTNGLTYFHHQPSDSCTFSRPLLFQHHWCPRDYFCHNLVQAPVPLIPPNKVPACPDDAFSS